MSQLRIDAKFPPQGTVWDDIRDAAQLIDTSSLFEGIWFFDHLASVQTGPNGSDIPQSIFEGWSIVAALASITKNVRLGLLVSSLPYRPLGLLTKIVSTLDNISSGRIDLGLGAGNNELEAKAFGIPFPSVSDRIAMLEESCQVLQLLLQNTLPVVYSGKFIQINGARNDPSPINGSVPIFIGGKGEKKMFPIVAKYADFWNYSNGTPEEFGVKFHRLSEISKTTTPDRPVPRASVQVQVKPTEIDSSTTLAEAYIAQGATHIVLYALANQNSVQAMEIVASRLK